MSSSTRAERGGAEPRVAVHAVGELSSQALERALGAWFQDSHYGLDFISEPALDARRLLAPATDHLVHAWLSFESGYVYIRLARSDHAPSHARYLLRRLPLAGELDLLALEQVAQMAHSSIEALLEQQSATTEGEFLKALPGAARTAVARPLSPKPARSAAAGRRYQGKPAPRMTLGLVGRASSAASWIYGPGLGAGVTWQVSTFRLGPVARLSYGLPSRIRQRDVELTFRSQSASIELAFSQASAFGYDLALGPHLERTKLDVRTLDRELRAALVPTDVRFCGLFAGGAHWHPFDVRVALQVFLLLPIPASTFELVEPTGQRTVFLPWRLQPGLRLELGPMF